MSIIGLWGFTGLAEAGTAIALFNTELQSLALVAAGVLVAQTVAVEGLRWIDTQYGSTFVTRDYPNTNPADTSQTPRQTRNDLAA